MTQLYCYDNIICVAHEKLIFKRKMTRILKENEKTSWQIENHVITYKSSHLTARTDFLKRRKSSWKKLLTKIWECDNIIKRFRKKTQNLDNWITKQPWTLIQISFGFSWEWCLQESPWNRTKVQNLNITVMTGKEPVVLDRNRHFYVPVQHSSRLRTSPSSRWGWAPYVKYLKCLFISKLIQRFQTFAAWLNRKHFIWEFDPGSGWTLAACLTHASRTKHLTWFFGWRSGDWVADGWVTRG